MTTIPDAILIACLDALEDGVSAAEIMSRYPEYVAELRPFLDTAVMLNELPPPPPEIAAELSKKAFLQEATTMKTAAAPRPARRSWFQLLRPVLALGLVLIAISAIMVSGSASALPGDALYATKRFVEDVRLSRTTDTSQRETLLESFAEERIREVNSLLKTSRAVEVAFSGNVDAITDAQWVIGGVPVKVSPDTVITGTILEGVEAEVNGRIESGMLTAVTITLPETELPEPEPTPTATPLPPTETPTTPTATPVPPTATPSPTPEVEEPIPTPTPKDKDGDENDNESEDNENENEEENENDSEDDNNDNDADSEDNDSRRGPSLCSRGGTRFRRPEYHQVPCSP